MGDLNVQINSDKNPGTITVLDTFESFLLKESCQLFNTLITEHVVYNYHS